MSRFSIVSLRFRCFLFCVAFALLPIVVPSAEAATFVDGGAQLTLTYTSANEQMTLANLGTSVVITDVGGTFSGTNDANVSGNGTATLTVTAAGIAAFSSLTFNSTGTSGTTLTFASSTGAYSQAIALTNVGTVGESGAQTFNSAVSIFATGAISLSNAGNVFKDTVSLTDTGSSSVDITSNGALSLGQGVIGGALTISANGAITQSGALTVFGATSFSANGSVILSDATNIFADSVAIAALSGDQIGNLTLTNTGSSAGPLTLPSNISGNLAISYPQAALTLPAIDAAGSLSAQGGPSLVLGGAISGASISLTATQVNASNAYGLTAGSTPISVIGQINLNSAPLTATLPSAPSPGQTFALLNASGQVQGQFGSVSVTNSAALPYSVAYSTKAVTAEFAGHTTTTLSSGQNASTYGQSVTFTAIVAPVAPATAIPTGTVTFLDGGSPIGTGTLLSGVTTFTTTSLSVGSHTITAQYGGDNNFPASAPQPVSNTLILMVSKKSTTVFLSVAPDHIALSQSIMITATVAGDPPTGTVSFTDNGNTLPCSPVTLVPGTTNSTAVCTDTPTGTGSHTIMATYSGDGNYAGATSSAAVVTVGADATAAPTLDRWALMLMAGLLGAGVFWRLRRAERPI